MHMQGLYDSGQDRILLRLWDATGGEDTALWLTRRQWTEIAAACKRVGASTEPRSKSDRPRKSMTPAGGSTGGPGSAKSTGGPGGAKSTAVSARLVSGVRFRRLPSGLRIEIATEAPTPLALNLTGDNLAFFADLVERLAAKAKWDLPAALARLDNPVAPKKRMLH